MDRRAIFGPWLVLGVAALVGIIVGRPGESFIAPPLPVVAATAPASLTVHVSGWVAVPGLVELEEGARVADALEAAGGVRVGGRTHLINLAQTVVDGQRIDVPGPGETVETVAGDGKVRINQADAVSMETLPGVGPVLAGRIVAYREEHGPFQTPEDLLDVPGIGESKLDSIRDLIVVP